MTTPRRSQLSRQRKISAIQQRRLETLRAEGVPTAEARQLARTSITTPAVQAIRQDYNEQRKARERARWFRRQETRQSLEEAARTAERLSNETFAIRTRRVEGREAILRRNEI